MCTQIPDILIINKTEYMIQPLPIPLKHHKLVCNKNNKSFLHTACYRGYKATWEYKINKLYLSKIEGIYNIEKPIDATWIRKKIHISHLSNNLALLKNNLKLEWELIEIY